MNGKKWRFTGLISRNKQGQIWVQDPFSGNYHEMDEVGRSICLLLKEPKDRDELIRALTEEYDVSPEQCAQDIAPFLEKMLSCGLIREADR